MTPTFKSEALREHSTQFLKVRVHDIKNGKIPHDSPPTVTLWFNPIIAQKPENRPLTANGDEWCTVFDNAEHIKFIKILVTFIQHPVPIQSEPPIQDPGHPVNC